MLIVGAGAAGEMLLRDGETTHLIPLTTLLEETP